jgi:hypothetical protein
VKRTYRQRIAFGLKTGLTQSEATMLADLKTPADIQDFISALRPNREADGHTLKSVQSTLHQKNAHCIEGAFVAATALWLGGDAPLVMDLQAHNDSDHVVTLFKQESCWGAISRSNHVWLRWRDPVYRSLRELAMSYFHEYTNDHGHKTLRTYSRPFDLRRLPLDQWLLGHDDCWEAGAALDDAHHYALISTAQAKNLKPRDRIENTADRLR